jgi:hypothetical protein
MRSLLSWRLLLVLGIAVVAVSLVRASAPRGPQITVSKETTFITEPLTADGYVDYLAALNAVVSNGVTPENNAAVPLYQAVGPKDVPEACRDHVAKMLGIEPLPIEGKYLEDSTAFLRRNPPKQPATASPGGENDPVRTAEAQFEKAQQRPWSKDEFPLVAAWLAENEKPLELAAAAARRPRFYFPLFAAHDSTTLIEVLLPLAQHSRTATRALSTRAMLRLKSGKIDEAWQDILACHRLARLVGQGSTIVEGLVGYAIEGVACHADAALAHYARPSADQARRFAEDLRQLPPFPKMVDKVVTGERFMYLDAVSMIARRGPVEIGRLTGGTPEKSGFAASLANFAGSALVNWDETLRMGNAWYDRFGEAFSKPTRAERDAALAKIDQDVRENVQKFKDPRYFLGDMVSSSPRRAAGREMGRMFVALLLPAITAVAKAEDRAGVNGSMGRVALALGAYRADHGAYPAELAQLCPKYLAAVPEDFFAKGPLHFKRTTEGYVLWSVGINGKDEGGFGYGYPGDASAPVNADDIAIRMPVVEKK